MQMFLYQFGENHVILNSVFLRNILIKFISQGGEKENMSNCISNNTCHFLIQFPGITQEQ